MEDVKQLMQDHYIRYASYVILDRAIPSVIDGLKPVQRRILETLFSIDDGKLHKVANVVGQTMALHPHGDNAIADALINLANKDYLLDKQGNFGNPYTGDPAAASRYIETRLSPLAKETLFNPAITPTHDSYDGRQQEPYWLPAKIPLTLMLGAEGIAVGMSTRILPHNFNDLLESEIAILEGNEFELLPDFALGGIMDASEYEKGRGKVTLRASIEELNPKTVVIREICHGTTTESVIRSIDEAAKKGKIKIESINDYTAEKVEIEVNLPRGHYAKELIDALYHYTDCEVTLHSSPLVIRDDRPWLATVDEVLRLHVELLKGYLKAELEIERDALEAKIFAKSLEEIFIENRIYKKLETVKSADKVFEAVDKGLQPFLKNLSREPTKEEIEKLLTLPIRRISLFDLEKNRKEIGELEKKLRAVERHLKNIKQYTIKYIRGLIDKFGKEYPRRTKISSFEKVDVRAVASRKLRIGFDPKKAFIGTKVAADQSFECTNFDKVLVMYHDGTYQVINPPEKQYLGENGKQVVYVGLADKESVFSVAYIDEETGFPYAKRFVVKQFILDKEYRFLDEGQRLHTLSTHPQIVLKVKFKPKLRQKIGSTEFDVSSVQVKGVSARGVRIAAREVKKIQAVLCNV